MHAMSQRIIVGVDGSKHSREALGWAVRQARITDARLDVIGVWSWASTWGYVPMGDSDPIAATGQMLDETIAAEVEPRDLPRVHRHVLEGAPAQVLMEAAVGADLLVVGSRGHGELAGMLIGSVSQHLVTHAPCPVVVVRS
jgi:nucleotide-binding universal stress UspA family protein